MNKIQFHKYYILILSNKLVDLVGFISGFTGNKDTKKAMGFAVFPCFVVLRNLTHPMTQQWLNHERIHIHQALSTLGLTYVLTVFEYIYARILLKYSHVQAYWYEAVEQEAYLNQHNPEYLKTRKPTSILHYIKNKKKIHTDENYKVVIEN